MSEGKKKELKHDGMVILVLGVNTGEKSAVMVEHGFRVSGDSRVRLGKGHTEMCKGNQKKRHAATSPENWHGAADWQSKHRSSGLG